MVCLLVYQSSPNCHETKALFHVVNCRFNGDSPPVAFSHRCERPGYTSPPVQRCPMPGDLGFSRASRFTMHQEFSHACFKTCWSGPVAAKAAVPSAPGRPGSAPVPSALSIVPTSCVDSDAPKLRHRLRRQRAFYGLGCISTGEDESIIGHAFRVRLHAPANSPAYGIDQLAFGSINGDGTGQTIALVDAYDDPDLVNSTASNFATSDLAMFDKQFGLPTRPASRS